MFGGFGAWHMAIADLAKLWNVFEISKPNHVWSYDFVADRTHDGKAFRMLCIIDESTREALAIGVARKLKATYVIEALCYLFILRGGSRARSLSSVDPDQDRSWLWSVAFDLVNELNGWN